MVSDKKIFPCFSLYKPMQNMGTLGRGHVWPNGHNMNNFVEVYWVMLHTKYQGSKSYGFRKEEFFMFPYISLCKTCDPRERAICGPGEYLNKLGRGILGNATY